MPAGIRNGLLVICAVLTMALPTYAETQTFADLLAQAKLQAATGHRWAPPGDNMTETIMRMMDLIGTATPAQLSELSTLLNNSNTVPPPPSLNADSPTEEPPAPAVPAPSASQSSPALALTAPAPPPVLPSRPEPAKPSPITSSQAVPAPGSRAGILFTRGVDAELRGNISGARRFYLGAAEQGDAAAARNLGRLYDPAYLKKTALGGVDPDPALARHWYERAVKLGDPEAGLLLEALSVR
ncbi:MAG TPA: hypothetical protein VGM42_05550 [Rhodopila sp.]|jgi:TPR repeat protein